MKRILTVTFLCLLLTVLIDHVPVVAQTTLAEALNSTINGISWSGSPEVVHYGIVFGKASLSGYDSVSAYGKDAVWLKRLASIDGYTSSTIDQKARSALESMSMSGGLPITYNDVWLVYDRYMCEGFTYAQSFGISKYSMITARSTLASCYNSAPNPLLGYNAGEGWNPRSPGRYYDECGESLNLFLEMGESTIPSSIWNYLNSAYWNGDIYTYVPNSGFECEVGPFAFVIGNYKARMGTITNFDRVSTTLYNTMLKSGWSSMAWGEPAVMKHASGNPEKRLENSMIGVAAMQAYYDVSNWQSSLTNLLKGGTPAWQHVWNSGFRSGSLWSTRYGGGTTKEASAMAAMYLFLCGIIPQGGSLAIPMIEERYQDYASFIPASDFRFDYANHKIRIPVWSGSIGFLFGSTLASYSFGSDGVYEVQFSNDWNSITSATRINSLNSQLPYLKSSSTPPPPPNTSALTVNAEWIANETNLSFNPLTGVPVTIASKTKNTPCTFDLEASTYAVSVPQKFGNYKFLKWKDGSTSTTRTVSLTTDQTLTVQYVKTGEGNGESQEQPWWWPTFFAWPPNPLEFVAPTVVCIAPIIAIVWYKKKRKSKSSKKHRSYFSFR